MKTWGLGGAGGGEGTLLLESSGMMRVWGKLVGLGSLGFQNLLEL